MRVVKSVWSTIALLVLFAAGTAQADRHYGIITDCSSRKDRAWFDISTYVSAEIGVKFTVFDNGGIIHSALLQNTSYPAYFVSSTTSSIPDLCSLSGGGAALVVVETTDANGGFINTPSSAILHQRSQGATLTTYVPADQVPTTSLAFPVGSLEDGTTLFVGAVAAEAQVFLDDGSAHEPNWQPLRIASNAVIQIPILTPNIRYTLTAANPIQDIVAVLVVKSGARISATMLRAP